MNKLDKVGKVYFIKSENSNLIKIGLTYNDVNSRLKQIQTGNPEKLIIYRVVETFFPEKLEEYFHLYFEEYQKFGEWFDVPQEAIDNLIDNLWITKENGLFTVDFIDLDGRNKNFEARIQVGQYKTKNGKVYIGWDTRTTGELEYLAWEAINSLLGIIKQTRKQYPNRIFYKREE